MYIPKLYFLVSFLHFSREICFISRYQIWVAHLHFYHDFRFIKSQYAGKQAAPGSHSSRAQIETRSLSDKLDIGVKSSALSDTSKTSSFGKFELSRYKCETVRETI